MDGRHEYILTTVSERLGMTVDDTEDFMLEEDQVCTERGVVTPTTFPHVPYLHNYLVTCTCMTVHS